MNNLQLPALPKIVLGVGFFILIVLTLIYLNIIPANFIPTFGSKQAIKLLLPCPVAAIQCQNSKPIVYKGKTVGIGMTLSAGTPIAAVFSGTIREATDTGQIVKVLPHPMIEIKGSQVFEGKSQKFTATYNFFGKPDISAVQVQAGSIIAQASAGSFPVANPFKGVNLIFSVTKDDGTPVEVEFK